ncbi:gp19.5 family protein [Pseudomonas petrae]|uniref:gp19.5 family protein n=1 Tax=Pseudomonas petrae TaxID=2912190 RepID=UPI003AFFF302
MTTQWVTTCVAVLRTLATHRVTYRFLGLLAVTLGVTQGGPLVQAFGDVVCVLLGGCDG